MTFKGTFTPYYVAFRGTERENKADGQSGAASVSASEFVKKAEEQNK